MATTKVIKDLTEFNPGNPDYILNATNAVTVINAGGNQYNFNGVYGKFGLRIGTTVLTGVPSAHPIAVLNNGLTGITYTGTVNEGTLAVGGITYTFYSGDVTITVTGNFGVASYYCKIHGYMGGQDNLVSVYSTAGLKMPTGAAYSGTTEDGMVRNDTDGTSQGSASTMQHFNGTDWKNFVNLPNSITADYLVVGGGGGGGGSNPSNATTIAGGGGAGGYKQISSYSILKNTPYTVTIGSGGSGNNAAAGDDGLSSVFSNITATGGVGGGSSGGNSGDSPQNTGGTNYVGGVYFGAGGGAGAGSGQNGNNGTSSVGGNGGNGIQSSITGTSTYYGGGGGGAIYQNTPGSGGLGGGGNGYGEIKNGDSGIINTGGGGGGGGYLGGQPATETRGGNGGAGTVILRYPTASVSSHAVTGTLDTVADTAYPVANTAYYKLNGDAVDSSGNGNNGTATSVTYAAGRFGQAAVFNGSSSSITLTQPVNLSTDNFTYSFWIYPTSNTGYQAPLAQYGKSTAARNFYSYRNGSALGKIVFGLISTGGAFYQLNSEGTTPLNQWSHVVFVRDSSTQKIYLDGQLSGTLSNTTTTSVSAEPFLIGDTNDNASEFFTGSMDQLRMFSTALSAANVTSLYNEGTVNESTDGTDSILQFIGGTGTITFS